MAKHINIIYLLRQQISRSNNKLITKQHKKFGTFFQITAIVCFSKRLQSNWFSPANKTNFVTTTFHNNVINLFVFWMMTALRHHASRQIIISFCNDHFYTVKVKTLGTHKMLFIIHLSRINLFLLMHWIVAE